MKHRSARRLVCALFMIGCGPSAAPADANVSPERDAHVDSDGGRNDTGLAPRDTGLAPLDASIDTGSVGASYSTSFDGTESPISEGGHWTHQASPWAIVATGAGVAYGTQPGDGAYTDSYAIVSGAFGPNQSVSVVIHRDASLAPGGTREVEILLRASDGPTSIRTYECNLAWDGGYAEIVRWNGALGDYTYVAPQGSGGPGAVHDGDVFRAEIVGSVIRTWLNDRMLQQVDVTSIGGTVLGDGNPGIAFWRGSGASASPGDYGFTSFSATTLP